MKNFLVVTNRNKDHDLSVTNGLIERLKARGVSVGTDPLGDYDCCIALGGDGTIISTARLLKNKDIPILGINLGHLGFMSSVEKNDIDTAIDLLIAENYYVEERMMINARIIHKGERSENEFCALNDVVISRLGFSRMISAKAFVNDAIVNTYFGDGIIISTPTGSTGYNLSAGGPIVTPEAELMVITPICPHSLNTRSVVVAAKDRIRVVVDTMRDDFEGKAVVTIDGQESIDLENEDEVEVFSASSKTKLIRFKDRGFFKVLHLKLSDQNN
ncbi:MAG: NAD(+)/NADH kinase [Lachnospiraceae bacterium]|nr:NAD(+)/NADH kinase [Lachnospiraceae bacterium]